MKENVRRPLLFLITVGIGSLIIVVDAQVEVIVAGTVLAGFLALIVTGALNLADLKPSNLRSALRERSESSKAAKSGTPTQKPSLIRRLASAEIDLSHLPGMLATLMASVRETITHARAPEAEKKRAIEKLDAMLDQAVDGAVPDQSITPAPPKAGGVAVDPLASLGDLDLDSLEDLDLDGETSGPKTAFESDQISLLSEEEASAVSDILKAHQSELDDLDLAGAAGEEVPLTETGGALPSLAADTPGLPESEGMPDMSALSEELSALDDLDLDEIEIEGEEDEEEEVEADLPAADEDVPEETVEEPEEDFDMVSFASGGTVDDDLIAALKSDVKKKKYVEDISLVRELKGQKFEAEGLATELEDILAMMKSK
ncbi:hypothetical protein [Methanoculleus sp. 7T]|uniref:hypothetical protein n=1 Tax=Methanoculleus sp. 7T TaxID=2937282 RepID=UPI0020BDB7BE|nr:hypothetical protein [Methanoculleus sp. 7T]